MTQLSPALASRLAELTMTQLMPCDLGEGVEVVHDVDAIEVEMECDLGDDEDAVIFIDRTEPMVKLWFEHDPELIATATFAREDAGTCPYERLSAPYERIEIEIEPRAFRQATIEEAKRLPRPRPHLTVRRRRSLFT